jgi:hypothetical protein
MCGVEETPRREDAKTENEENKRLIPWCHASGSSLCLGAFVVIFAFWS